MEKLNAWLAASSDAPLFMETGRARAAFVLIKVKKSERIVLLFGQKNRLTHDIQTTDFGFAGLYLPQENQYYYVSRDFKKALTTTYGMERSELACHSLSLLSSRITHEIQLRIEQIVDNSPANLSIQKLKDESYIYELARLDNPDIISSQAQYYFQQGQRLTYMAEYVIRKRNLAAIMDYIENPVQFVQKKADAYIEKNEEEILYYLLRNEKINAEYDRLAARRDFESPLAARFHSLLQPLPVSNVEVEIFKNGHSMRFDMSKSAFEEGRYLYTSDWIIPPSRKAYLAFYGDTPFCPSDVNVIKAQGQPVYVKGARTIPDLPAAASARNDMEEEEQTSAAPSLPEDSLEENQALSKPESMELDADLYDTILADLDIPALPETNAKEPEEEE